MKVAIIGAGVAGLCCAHELEAYGISPVIFERNSFIGEQISRVGAFLKLGNRPIKDAIQFTKEKFGITIRPLNTIHSLIHHSSHQTTVIQGNFGYFIQRCAEPEDLKRQIFSQLNKTKIFYCELGDYEKLSKEYDYVVVANGHPAYAKELGCWKELFNGFSRGAVILGDFDPNAMIMYINKKYCKNGYAYLAPFDRHKASVNLVVSDIEEKEMEYFWREFLCTENLRYDVVQEYTQQHESGYAYPHQVGNILFSGNAGGALDPFLGLGQLNSIIMGVMAGRSIATGKEYEKLIQPVIRRNFQMYEFRKGFNKLDNPGCDALLRIIGFPGIRHLIYHTGINVIKYGAGMLKLFSQSKDTP